MATTRNAPAAPALSDDTLTAVGCALTLLRRVAELADRPPELDACDVARAIIKDCGGREQFDWTVVQLNMAVAKVRANEPHFYIWWCPKCKRALPADGADAAKDGRTHSQCGEDLWGIPLAALSEPVRASVEIALDCGLLNMRREPRQWWCPTCMGVVAPHNVTFEERHDVCGSAVQTVPSEVSPMTAPAGWYQRSWSEVFPGAIRRSEATRLRDRALAAANRTARQERREGRLFVAVLCLFLAACAAVAWALIY